MKKILLILFFLALEYMCAAIFSFPWKMFDGLLALVVIYAFFHSLDLKDLVFFALLCGFLRDAAGLDKFGFSTMSYAFCALAVMAMARFLYRFNWLFVFPLVFIGVFLNSYTIGLLKYFSSPAASSGGWFFIRTLVLAAGTTAVAYPLYFFSKKCAPEFIG